MAHELSNAVLAVYASARGIGFALFESPTSLIDWGVKVFTGSTKSNDSVKAVMNLIDQYAPDILVIDDPVLSAYPRTKRIRALYRMLSGGALAANVHVERIPRHMLQTHFEAHGARTKHERATYIASLFPGLLRELPHKRKVWQSEHPKADLFEALALGVVSYAQPV